MTDGFSLKTRPILDRFWLKVSRLGPDECWEWTGKRKQQIMCGNLYAYGIFALPQIKGAPRVEVRAHRFAWEIWHRARVPDGMEILHSCDNPPCCNPTHLRPGTHAENMADIVERGRHYKLGRTECPNGHDLTAPNATRAVRSAGKRDHKICRRCANARNRRYEQGKRIA